MAEPRLAERAAALPGALFGSLLDWFYPRHCYHCGFHLHDGRARMLCKACAKELAADRIVGPMCVLCGLPFARPSEDGSSSDKGGDALPAAGLQPGTLCITCRAEKRHFDRARAFVAYAGPASSVIREFKFGGQFFLGPRFLDAMLDRGWMPADIKPAEFVVPVPLHPRRRRERGYDQALLLGKVFARRLGCKLLPGVLVRTRYTSQQALLPMVKRGDNVRGAFAVTKPAKVRQRRVLLVDDVLSATGLHCPHLLS